MIKPALLAPVLVLSCALAACGAPYKPSAWLEQVPPATHALANPLTNKAAAVAGGRDTYALYCARCHSDDAAGRRNRPGLRTARIRGETDGDIFWILKNGSRNHGMPAWRSLGDTDLWQLVAYLRSLPPQPEP